MVDCPSSQHGRVVVEAGVGHEIRRIDIVDHGHYPFWPQQSDVPLMLTRSGMERFCLAYNARSPVYADQLCVVPIHEPIPRSRRR